MDLVTIVDAFWQHHQLSQGDREARLASRELNWAIEAVADAVESDEPLALLDLLVASEQADLCFLGAGPVEDLLSAGPRWDAALADRCRGSDRWRQVLRCVWLDEPERRALPALAAFLSAQKQ